MPGRTERWVDGQANAKELKGARQASLAAAREAAEARRSAFQAFRAAARQDDEQAARVLNFMRPVTDPDILATRSASFAMTAGEEAA